MEGEKLSKYDFVKSARTMLAHQLRRHGVVSQLMHSCGRLVASLMG